MNFAFVATVCVVGSLAGVSSADDKVDSKLGQRVYQHWCSHCHDAGLAKPGTQRLEWLKGKEFSVLTERSDLPSAYIKYVVRNGLGQMPMLRPTEISEVELEALAVFLGQP